MCVAWFINAARFVFFQFLARPQALRLVLTAARARKEPDPSFSARAPFPKKAKGRACGQAIPFLLQGLSGSFYHRKRLGSIGERKTWNKEDKRKMAIVEPWRQARQRKYLMLIFWHTRTNLNKQTAPRLLPHYCLPMVEIWPISNFQLWPRNSQSLRFLRAFTVKKRVYSFLALTRIPAFVDTKRLLRRLYIIYWKVQLAFITQFSFVTSTSVHRWCWHITTCPLQSRDLRSRPPSLPKGTRLCSQGTVSHLTPTQPSPRVTRFPESLSRRMSSRVRCC